jgi:hypothetical protein
MKKKKNLHTVATRRPLAVSGWSKEVKHNLERPVEVEFSDLICPTSGKQRLPTLTWVFFLNKRGREIMCME